MCLDRDLERRGSRGSGGNGTTGGGSATGVAGGGCGTLGGGLLDLSLVISINACMPDSTV